MLINLNAEQIAKVFYQYLKTHHLLPLLPEVIVRLQEQNTGRPVNVFSVHQLSATQKEKIAHYLWERFQYRGEVKFLIDPGLIAGLRIEYGDAIIDYSWQNKLNQLEKRLQNLV